MLAGPRKIASVNYAVEENIRFSTPNSQLSFPKAQFKDSGLSEREYM